MLPSVGFRKFKFGVLGLALVFMLGLRAFPGAHPASVTKTTTCGGAREPPCAAPPVTVDSQLA